MCAVHSVRELEAAYFESLQDVTDFDDTFQNTCLENLEKDKEVLSFEEFQEAVPLADMHYAFAMGSDFLDLLPAA